MLSVTKSMDHLSFGIVATGIITLAIAAVFLLFLFLRDRPSSRYILSVRL